MENTTETRYAVGWIESAVERGYDVGEVLKTNTIFAYVRQTAEQRAISRTLAMHDAEGPGGRIRRFARRALEQIPSEKEAKGHYCEGCETHGHDRVRRLVNRRWPGLCFMACDPCHADSVNSHYPKGEGWREPWPSDPDGSTNRERLAPVT